MHGIWARPPSSARCGRAIGWLYLCPHVLHRSSSHGSNSRVAGPPAAAAASVGQLKAEDSWIATNVLPLVAQPGNSSLQQLHETANAALSTLRLPNMRNEEYRYTDLQPLQRCTLQAASSNADLNQEWLSSLTFPEAANTMVVVVNGRLRSDLSRVQGLPAGVYLGSIQGAGAQAARSLGAQSSSRGGPFSVLNSATAEDVLCLVLPDNVQVTSPIHVLYIAAGSPQDGSLACTAPRLLVLSGEGSSAELVEEFVTAAGASSRHFTCAISEVTLGAGATLRHGYLQREGAQAVHVKGSLVQQAQHSNYSLVEVALGGSLTRHDLGIMQNGIETSTSMRHFLLCGPSQLHDLHSKLQLDYPGGQAEQLHKCISASPTARGVFDGNVQVNRLAQKTDAQQLSRNLLLAPRATVNVKPNLQIIADDVKCTHGCTVSDLSEEELFYFRARGIPADTARQALVYSFGSEVVQQLKHRKLTERIQASISQALSSVQQAAAADAWT